MARQTDGGGGSDCAEIYLTTDDKWKTIPGNAKSDVASHRRARLPQHWHGRLQRGGALLWCGKISESEQPGGVGGVMGGLLGGWGGVMEREVAGHEEVRMRSEAGGEMRMAIN